MVASVPAAAQVFRNGDWISRAFEFVAYLVRIARAVALHAIRSCENKQNRDHRPAIGTEAINEPEQRSKNRIEDVHFFAETVIVDQGRSLSTSYL